jgi:nicotinamidase/pyrazinamidase
MKKALIIVDVQNDFASPDGTLYVKDGEKSIPFINSLMLSGGYDLIIATCDWHPKKHISFAANHKNAKIYETIDAQYGKQVLWPVHCVQNSRGAELHPDLFQSKINYALKKGADENVDSYSAVYDNGRSNYTFLPELLSAMDIVDVVGIATDYCVKFTALDLKENLPEKEVRVLLKGCAGVAPETSKAAAEEMETKGVKIVK